MQNPRESWSRREEVTTASEDDIIDCYRHFIANEVLGLILREIDRYAEHDLHTHEIRRR